MGQLFQRHTQLVVDLVTKLQLGDAPTPKLCFATSKEA